MTPQRLRHEVIFREEIRTLLESLDQANAALTRNLPSPQVAVFRAGWVSALQAVAAAYAIPANLGSSHPTFQLHHPPQLTPRDGDE